MNLPKRLELLLCAVFAFPNACRRGNGKIRSGKKERQKHYLFFLHTEVSGRRQRSGCKSTLGVDRHSLSQVCRMFSFMVDYFEVDTFNMFGGPQTSAPAWLKQTSLLCRLIKKFLGYLKSRLRRHCQRKNKGGPTRWR